MLKVNERENIGEIRKVSTVGLIVNLLLSVLKISAGILGNSQAVVADGIHSISDSVTDIAVIVGSVYWSAPPDDDHPHGHGRIETAVTVFIGLVLVAIAGGLGWNAVTGFFEKSDEAVGKIAFFAAIISIIIKEILFRWNNQVGKKMNCKAMIANAWHHRSDALSSVPAALAVVVANYFPEYGFVDKVGAVIVCLFIFYSAFKIVWPALKELTDTGVSESERLKIEEIGRNVEGVKDVHKCRTRFVGSGVQVDIHVLVDPEMSVKEGHDVSSKVKNTMIEKCDIVIDVIVHLEPFE
jgi:cation diffusion facilitator family transporter